MNASITLSWTKLRSALLELPPLREDERKGKHRSVKSLTFGMCPPDEGIKRIEGTLKKRSKASTPALSFSFTSQANDLIEGVSEVQLCHIYEAKCADLRLPFMPLQQRRFFDFCSKRLRRRAWDFTESGIGPRAAKAIADCIRDNPHFCKLLLGKNELGDKGAVQVAKSLSKALNIVHLDLSSNSLGPEGISEVLRIFCRHDSLISLDLSSHEGLHRNRLALEGAVALGDLLRSNKFLVSLDISGTSIGRKGLEAVATGLALNNSLLRIGLGRNGIRGKALLPLCKLLPQSHLMHIILSGNHLGKEGAEALCTAINVPNYYPGRLLDISDSHLGFAASESIFSALANNIRVHTLLMSRNHIGDAPNPALANFISDNTAVKHLDLSDCGLRANGLEAIGQGLGRNHSINTLVLTGNAFGTSDNKDQFAALAAGLSKNSALQLLDLSSTRLNDQAVAALCEAIWTHTSLTQLLLKDNDIRDKGAALLANLTRVRRKMTKVTIENNLISFKYVSEIRSNLRGNAKFQDLNRTPKLRRERDTIRKSSTSVGALERRFANVQSEITTLKNQVEHERSRVQQIRDQEDTKFRALQTNAENIKRRSKELTLELQTLKKETEVLTTQEERKTADMLVAQLQLQLDETLTYLKYKERHRNDLRSAGAEERLQFNRQIESLTQTLSTAKADKRTIEMSLASLRKQVEIARLELESHPKKRKRKGLLVD